MSITYGFYNSMNHDRMYDAIQLSSIFDGLIEDGVYQNIFRTGSNPFKVSGNGTRNQVIVDKGRAWFYHTWTYNDAPIILILPDAESGNYYRCDAIVLDINEENESRSNNITYVKGTKKTSTQPSDLASFVSSYKPTLIEETLHHQIPLYYVERRPYNVEISAPNIEDAYLLRNIGNADCNYVSGIINGNVDITAHLAHWESQWYLWFNGVHDDDTIVTPGFKDIKEGEVEDWFTQLKNYYKNDQKTGVLDRLYAELKDYTLNTEDEFNTWKTQQEAIFMSWFNNLVYVLDGDVAGHLQNEIDALGRDIVPITRGGTGNNEGYIHTGFKDAESTLGMFSTAEGMNTIASGESSHAEGGGGYTYYNQEAHFAGDRVCPTDETSVYHEEFITEPSIRLTGSATERVEPANKPGSGYEILAYNATDNTDFPGADLTSLYLGLVLKDETEGEILKHELICIGSANVGDPNYVGEEDDQQNASYTEWGMMGYDYEDVSQRYTTTYTNKDGESVTKVINDEVYWYIDGDTPTNSSIMVKGRWGAGLTKNPGSSYSQAYLLAGGSLYATYPNDKINLIIAAGNTHTYSLKLYYTYTTVNDDHLHTLEWAPAGKYVEIIASGTKALGNFSHAEGFRTVANEKYTHAEGYMSETWYEASHAEGSASKAMSIGAHSEGSHTEAGERGYITWGDHAEGDHSIAKSFPPSDRPYTIVSGSDQSPSSAHSEGYYNKSTDQAAHSEGIKTEANHAAAHSEGYDTRAYGECSHAEGAHSVAQGAVSHAEGNSSEALGPNSHAGGGAIAFLANQFVHGILGFGGYLEPITASQSISVNDKSYSNGGALDISPSCSFTIATNESGDDQVNYKCYLFILVSANDIEISAITVVGNSAYAPKKHLIVRDGTTLTNFPEITTNNSSSIGKIVIPSASIKRQCQIIRIM